ncbi:peptidoglycan editing factor PgeF [Oleiagrimonas sp. C23AA]|uniref:peptidoglycan editing factor PgeF n=1 Tax=Oleiagrimonas sp. C23AA TaxID=2719047 RepID=UPI00141DF36D|nr:peptidoglycan editing factor PgeF [Oleiagrimonas sp. C23AA]NII09954.1 peptidoglycan editing factor PgeF [Oleiagrimonas sp. C23AA]
MSQLEPWLIPDWSAPRGVGAAVTTRHGPGSSAPPFERFNLGTSAGDHADTVQANREALAQGLGLPSAPRWLRQVHGTRVAQLGPLAGEVVPEADAAVSHVPGTVLAILTADCLPVLLCAEDGSEIGAAHAGWRGLAGGVLEATLAAMHTPASRVRAWLGPCIGAASYEIGAEVREAFVRDRPDAACAFTPSRPGHWLADLPLLARQRLQMAGVTHISGAQIDTFIDTRFYSYRRDGTRSGRFASLIWLSAT